MIDLSDQFVLSKILPGWNVTDKVFFAVEVILADPRVGIAADACVGASHEKASHQHQGNQTKCKFEELSAKNVVRLNVL